MKGILCFFKFLIKKKIFQRIINYFFTTKLHFFEGFLYKFYINLYKFYDENSKK